jgi:DNA repair exonuclease SbcCD ATPase subunit
MSEEMGYNTEYINYNTKIKRIYHISDIHINLQAKHNEYRYVFKNLYEYLKKEKEQYNITSNKEIESCIVITGDILHSKTELLPECIELTRQFLTELCKLMPTIIIAGNHDLNINNKERLDGLTPITNGVDANLPLYYLKKSGLYHFGNIIWSVSSVRDYLIIPPSLIKGNNKTKICLFHGRVNGALLFNKSKLDGEINKKTNKTITPESFRGYDYVLMGDIHKQQYMNKEKTMAYSGSLIQQNHGESIKGHGVLVWDIENGSSKFDEIANNHCYYSHTIKDNVINETIISCLKSKLAENIRLRLFMDNTPNSKLQEIISHFKNGFNVLEVSYQDCSKGNESDIKKEITMNITNIDYQNNIIEEYLKRYTETNQTTIDYVKKLNAISNKQLDENKMVLNARWKLLKLEFSNLFSYGEKNVIHFKDYKGILGIIAPNHMGKSAIIDIILFTLYDKFPRKGNVKDIINNRKKTYKTKIMFKIGGWRYVVFKSGVKNDKGRVSSKVEFYRINKENIKEILSEDTAVKTKNAILKYVGLYDDIIQTNISLQHNNCNFIEAENTARKKELERILQVDFIGVLLKKSNIMITEKKAVYKHLQNNCYEESILNLNKNIAECVEHINNDDALFRNLQHKIDQLESIISKKRENIIPNIEKKRHELLENINKNYEQINITDSINALQNKKVIINKEKEILINNYKDFIYNIQQINKDKYQQINKDLITILKVENERENNIYISNKNKKLNYYDENIEKLIKNVDKLIERNFKTCNKEEILNKIKEVSIQIKTLKDNETKLDNLVSKKCDIERDCLELKEQINDYNQEEMPPSLMTLLEETNILELNDTIEESESIIIKEKTIKKRREEMEEFKEVFKTKNIYDYLEDYQTEQETELNNKMKLVQLAQTKQDEKNNIINSINNIIMNYGNKDINNIGKNIKYIENRLNILNKSKDDYKKELEIINKNELIKSNNININSKLYKLKTDKENLKNQNNNEYILFSKLFDCWTSLQQYQSNLVIIDRKLNDIESNKKEIEEVERLYELNVEIKGEIAEYEEELNALKEKESKIDYTLNVNKAEFVKNNTKLEEHKKEIVKMKDIEKELNIYQVYNHALKNLPFIIIKKVIPRLERKINELLSVCTDFMVKVEVVDNHIDIYIDRPIYNGSLILLNNASGFERFISSLAIRLALLDISQLPKPNFIAIDEGWTSFDYHNINNVRTIFDFLVEKFDFVLSISHLSQIKEHCHQQINLKKDVNGFSIIA